MGWSTEPTGLRYVHYARLMASKWQTFKLPDGRSVGVEYKLYGDDRVPIVRSVDDDTDLSAALVGEVEAALDDHLLGWRRPPAS